MKKIFLIVFSIFWLLILQGCSSSDAQLAAEKGDVMQQWTTTVLIETELWNMEAILYDSTPGHRDNFIKLVNEWFYNDLLFHRIIKGFMVQWGDPQSRGAWPTQRLWSGWPWYQIPAEIWASHIKWTLAAARNNNPEKKSSGSQFYIVQGQPVTLEDLTRNETQKWFTYSEEDKLKYTTVWWTPMLDNDYTVFWELISWLDVLDAIAEVETWASDRPVSNVTMKISTKK